MGVKKGVALNRSFTQIPNDLIRNRDVSDGAFRLICWITSHTDGFDVSFSGIRAALGYGRDGLRNIIKNAEENNYLVRVRTRDEKTGQFDWDYHVFASQRDAIKFRESIDGLATPGVTIDGLAVGGSPTGGLSTGGSDHPHKEYKDKEQQSKKDQSKNTPLTPQGEESASVEEEEGSELTMREEEPESESSDRPSSEREFIPIQPSQVSDEDKSSAPVVATRKQNTCLQDCRSGADVLEQLSNDPGILDCDPVPRTVLQEMQLRNWVWPWRRDRRTILPEFLQFHTNQMPTSKNDQADMSATEKARRNILNSEKTVGGLILLAAEFESFKSGAAQATKRVNGHEPIRIDFEERFVQAQRLGMVEGDWFRDELGQIRVRLFGGELVSQAKFMTLPLEKPKDLQTPEEARSLLDQIRQFKAQAAQKLHNSRAKQTKTPVANVAVAPKPLVDNVVGLCDRRAELALMQQLRNLEAELTDPALLKDPLTQAKAEAFVNANSDRFKAVRGKDQLIIAIEEPKF